MTIYILGKLNWILTQIKYINQQLKYEPVKQNELITHLKYLKSLMNNYLIITENKKQCEFYNTCMHNHKSHCKDLNCLTKSKTYCLIRKNRLNYPNLINKKEVKPHEN